MDWKRARRLLDETLVRQGLRRSTDAEWHQVRSNRRVQEIADFAATPEEDVAEEAAFLISFTQGLERKDRGRARHEVTAYVDPLSPPDWWEAESQRRLHALRDEREMLCLGAGLVEPSVDEVNQRGAHILRLPAMAPLRSVAEVAPLIHRMIQRQFKWFFSLNPGAKMLPDEEAGLDLLDFYRDEWDVIEYPSESWEQDGRTERTRFPPVGLAAAKETPPDLDRLHRRSLRTAQVLGITQAECLAWALTDCPFTIPWMPTTVGGEWTWDGEWSTVTIQVNSMSATAKAVAKAFTLARGAAAGPNARRRAPRPWPATTHAFVKARQREIPDETWEQRFHAFAEAYRDHPYKTKRTFQMAYYEQQKRGGK